MPAPPGRSPRPALPIGLSGVPSVLLSPVSKAVGSLFVGYRLELERALLASSLLRPLRVYAEPSRYVPGRLAFFGSI